MAGKLTDTLTVGKEHQQIILATRRGPAIDAQLGQLIINPGDSVSIVLQPEGGNIKIESPAGTGYVALSEKAIEVLNSRSPSVGSELKAQASIDLPEPLGQFVEAMLIFTPNQV